MNRVVNVSEIMNLIYVISMKAILLAHLMEAITQVIIKKENVKNVENTTA